MSTTRALVLSNPLAFRDQWHLPRATTVRLKALLESMDMHVQVTEDPEDIPLGTEDFRLLVLDIGTTAGDDSAIVGRAGRFLETGGALLALHATSVGLGQTTEGSRLLGGSWKHGVTWHPDEGDGVVEYVSPVTGETQEFLVFDELYSDLERGRSIREIAWHTLGGTRQPLAWVLDDAGNEPFDAETQPHRGRVAYSALGHSPRSYDSVGHLALLRDMVQWLVRIP